MPNRPLLDAAISALYRPMRLGLRIATGAEIARIAAPETPRQLCHAEIKAREVLAFGEPVEPDPWAGWRPCLPDMLPVVDAVPANPGLWCNFGHGHQGFTLSPTSASLLTFMPGLALIGTPILTTICQSKASAAAAFIPSSSRMSNTDRSLRHSRTICAPFQTRPKQFRKQQYQSPGGGPGPRSAARLPEAF